MNRIVHELTNAANNANALRSAGKGGFVPSRHIVLVNGNRLTEPMIGFNLEINIGRSYEAGKIDLDYFDGKAVWLRVEGRLMVEQIRKIYELVAELEELYPGRHFTPDGHMVGSIGEVMAAEKYGLKLFVASYPVHDAKAPDGRLVQIKATQGDKVALSECPEHLVVLKLFHDGSFEEVFNGPGDVAWGLCGKRQKTGQRPVSIAKLRKAMKDVVSADKLPTVGGE